MDLILSCTSSNKTTVLQAFVLKYSTKSLLDFFNYPTGCFFNEDCVDSGEPYKSNPISFTVNVMLLLPKLSRIGNNNKHKK